MFLDQPSAALARTQKRVPGYNTLVFFHFLADFSVLEHTWELISTSCLAAQTSFYPFLNNQVYALLVNNLLKLFIFYYYLKNALIYIILLFIL